MALVVLIPAPVAAQFGPIDALARRVSDLGFFFSRGGVTGSEALDHDPLGITSFGVELLFEVAEIPSGEARRRQAQAEPVTRHVLKEMEVRKTADGGVDTVYHYEVVRSAPSFRGDDILWTLEVGIGYGQLQGLEFRDPSLDLNATIRTLPSLTLYLSYEPLGGYVGMRTGFLRTQAMQVVDSGGAVFNGSGEAFMMGGLIGYAFAFDPTYVFIEGGYTVRNFPSVEWTGDGALPAGVPRDLDVSGWLVSAGIQFPVK